ncbi:glycoside hydrolase family 3 N-terminal domain-containing protein [Enterovirga aerilata]|uniref:beta-glucosidase n=1 Tax=Enterovirga aerilata TaxID=2730920 RepID=A0A849IK07_9HYPH|nr:glycoside hydrolase family 3 N-terminal domain-containing protein [Enterovirga sp. DB1703]NNM74263.1 glycosyl hydrolase [Enterovirga sp. DB1703]
MNRTQALLAAAFLACCAASPEAVADAAAERESRLEALLSRMTLEEKIGQLNLVPFSPTFDRGDLERGRIGAVLAVTKPHEIADVQAAARRSRHGIPVLVGLDVLHGLRTIFPVPMAEVASFDPELARETARQAGLEAAAIGINWTFAPMADLARDPRWGRMNEGFGEDPLLGRLFTRARVEGFREAGIATTLKHFAGYGSATGGRDYDMGAIAPGDLHDSYLPPFRAGIEAGSESVMSAFLSLNGVPVSASRAMLTGILRESWGYRGFVVSDWNSIGELMEHGVARDGAEAARKALLAGVDMDMYSGLYAAHLQDEVMAGRIPEAAVTEAARRVLRSKLAMGLFERPDPDTSRVEPAPPSPEARALARRAARDSAVLLRNEGVLPLAAGRRIAVIGELGRTQRHLVGPHAAMVRWEDGVSVLDGLRGRGDVAVSFAQGCDIACETDAGFAEAERAAREADVVLAVLGEANEMSGEAASRARLTLPGRQGELLGRLVAMGKPVVLVIIAGRPIELGPVIDRLDAVLMAWFPGTEGGNAIADLLFGEVDPAGKLPVSWPRTVGQVPIPYDLPSTGRPHDPTNHYTYRYVDEEITPLFPFGFGKSYTEWHLGEVDLPRRHLSKVDRLEVAATLRNTGRRHGRQVVQLYVRQLHGSRSRPARQLKAFRKIALAPGSAERLTLQVPVAELGFHLDDGTYVVEPGRYQVFLGTASDAPVVGEFEVLP